MLTFLVASVALIGPAACGGDGDGGGDGGGSPQYADGACIDRADLSFSDPSQAGLPEVVDCGSADAKGVLNEVDNYDKDCDPGKGFESLSYAGNEPESQGNFCIEPK